MATIPQIAMGFQQPAIASPLNMMAQISQIQAAQDANALRQAQTEKLAREAARENQLAELMSSGQPLTLQQLAPFGQAGLNVYKTQQEVQEQERKIGQERTYKFAQALHNIRNDPSLDTFSRTWQYLKDNGLGEGLERSASQMMLMTPDERLDAVRRFIDATPGMQKYIADIDEARAKALETSAKARKTTAEARKEETVLRGMVGGMTAEQRARLDRETRTELEKLQAARDALPPDSPQRIEIENRIDALGRPAAPTLTEVIDPDNPNRMLRVDARTYTGGSVGAPGVLGISGKEPAAAKREAVETEGREQFRSILDDLRANFDRLNQMRAITSTERGPISNVGTAIETTGVGQVASRAVGGKAQAIRDEISSSRSMLLSALKKVTGKSASELNSNVELRTFLDSISDPAKSYESAMAILDNMERTYLRGGEPSAGQRSAAPRGAAPSGERSFRTVQEAEAANLPKGTRVTIGGRPAIVE
jgi:hypothetical protein